MTDPKVQIFDIMACNVYVDYDFVPVKESHKFLIAFFPMKNAFVPDLIDEIIAYGPNGYQVEFKNQKYDLSNINGYITDSAFNSCWYMVNLPTGFMEEGDYKIEVRCKNGAVISKSRYQESAPGQKLVEAYLENKEKILKSYTPGTINGIPERTSLKNLKIKWTTLKEIANIDAYYIFRISLGKKPNEFNIQKLVWWDNVFVQSFSEKDAGLNRGEVTIQNELQPSTSYAYFVETTDSNSMGKTNICIFQPHQIISTPSASQEILAAKRIEG
ncbi:MAG: hypothetical protein ACFFAN_01335 [Promethearchaeota archaeon]